jgi:Ohr subfamily peroxiredoxin
MAAGHDDRALDQRNHFVRAPHDTDGSKHMNQLRKILYTAQATVEGGREGSGRTDDDRLSVDLDVPTEMGGSGGPGTNPEQLFAVGYAACFQSALLRIASGRNLDLGQSTITSHVSIGPDADGPFGLGVTLDLDAPQLDREQAADLMAQAHELCPYSRATRGNISVELMVGGQAIAETAGLA